MHNLDFLRANEEELSVNITSLIDVIFILLIFFMVSTQFKKNALPLDLPKSEDTTEQKADDSVKVLSVTQEKLALDSEELTLDMLEARLSALYEENHELAISLECERTVDFEYVVQVLTKLQQAGISRIGIVHDPLD